jgi:hypothetical protein
MWKENTIFLSFYQDVASWCCQGKGPKVHGYAKLLWSIKIKKKKKKKKKKFF